MSILTGPYPASGPEPEGRGGSARRTTPARPRPSEQPRWRRLVPTRQGLRAAVAGARAGTLPRAVADRWLLAALTVVVAFSATLAVAVPRLVTRTFDGGVRAAIEDAGAAAELAMSFPIAAQSAEDGELGGAPEPTVVTLSELQEAATTARQGLPAQLAPFAGATQLSLTGPALAADKVAAPGAGWTAPRDSLAVTFGAILDSTALGGAAAPAVRYVAGTAPDVAEDAAANAAANPTGPGAVPIAISKAAADRAGLGVGSRLRVETPIQRRMELRVTGVYEPVDPAARSWALLPGAIRPDVSEGPAGTFVALTGLLAPSAVTTAELALAPESMTVSLRQALDPSLLTTATAEAMVRPIGDLEKDPSHLIPERKSVSLATGLDELLTAQARTAAATRAQLSLVLVGLIGTAAVVMVLGTHLLIARRRPGLALEHARGASGSSIAYRLVLESLVVAALGCAAGTAAAVLLVPEVPGSWLPLAVVAGVAVVAPPVIGAWTARQAWARRRSPANRRARGRLAARARSRRLVLEATVVALAIGAVAALRNRGLLTTPAAGIDLLLAAAPLLFALAVTIVVLHLYAYPIKLVTAIARRGRGGVLHLATSRAQQALSALPLLALTVAFALVVMAGLLRGTLWQGQQLASWERMVGDARLTSAFSPITDAQIADVEAAPGVDVVAPATVLRDTQVRIGSRYERVNVVVVDGGSFDRLLAAGPVRYAGEMARLAAPPGPGTEAAPAVVSPDSVKRFRALETHIFVGRQFLAVTPVAGASVTATGWLPGEVVFVDRTNLPKDVDPAMTGVNTLWVTGPGAAAAVAAVADSDQVAGSRTQWLAAQRSSGLIDDLLRLLWLAVAAVGALAAVALIETVISGARERGRTLSFLRTLGFTARHGRWLTFGELVPLVLTGVVAGTLAGLGIVALLGPPLGLMVSTGGVTAPALAFDPPFAVAVAACAVGLLVLAVLVESAGRRRDRLAEVLRVGDAR